jgi:lysozyme
MDMSEYVYNKYPHMQQVAQRIKDNEGFRLNPYTLEYNTKEGKYVKEGFKTGGYGHRIQPNEEIPDTKEGWETVFNNDFEQSVKATEKLLTDASSVHPVVFGVLTEMVYQMGATGVSKFKNTLSHINNGNYEMASKEMLNSNWAKQTPDRAVRLADLVRYSK